MKIGIQTWGSNGDIRPMIALANGLQQHGHQVTLVASSLDNRCYSDECKALNIDYRQIPEKFNFDLETFAQKTMRMNMAQWLNALLDMAFLPYETIMLEAATQLAAENDLLIGHHFVYPLKIAAYQANKPCYSICLCHAIIESSTNAPFSMPDLGKWLYPLQWKLINYAFDLLFKKKLTQLWQKQNMPAIKHVLNELICSQELNLVAVDPIFCPDHKSWASHHIACGFLNLQTQHTPWTAPESLTSFLKQGAAPVYMTFGSLQKTIPEWSMDLFIDAAQLAGCRAIIQTSSPRYAENSQHGQCYFIGLHPHHPVFQQCAAIIHHGGAGTTHSATYCGKPSIILPFMDEQLFWGQILSKKDIAPPPLKLKHATAKKLAQRIQTLLNNQNYSDQAKKAGQQLVESDGVANAVQLIEKTYSEQFKA